MREFIYRAVEFGYHFSTFELEQIIGEKPVYPRIGEKDTLNGMLNLVANGNKLTILPKEPRK